MYEEEKLRKKLGLAIFSEEAIRERNSREAHVAGARTQIEDRSGGFGDEAHERRLETLIENSSFEKWKSSGHTKEARQKAGRTLSKRMLAGEIPLPSGFDREEFYSKKLSAIRSINPGKQIDLTDIDKYTGAPGVWSEELPDGTVTDVSETSDIGKEMLFSIRVIDRGIKNITKTDDEIIE